MPVILVVEDDPVMRKAIGTILNRGGYTVLNATNGREAMDLLDNAAYDVVVTDLMMPYANGLEVVNRIRNNRGRKEVGIIIVSATSNEDMVTEAFGLGADDYLKKPVMAGELVSRIRKLIARQQGLPTDHLPADMEDFVEAAPPGLLPGTLESPGHIAVAGFGPAYAVADVAPPMPAINELFPVAAPPEAIVAGGGRLHVSDRVAYTPANSSPEASMVAGQDANAGEKQPEKAGVNAYMTQAVIILGIIALLVIGMLLYIAL